MLYGVQKNEIKLDYSSITCYKNKGVKVKHE